MNYRYVFWIFSGKPNGFYNFNNPAHRMRKVRSLLALAGSWPPSAGDAMAVAKFISQVSLPKSACLRGCACMTSENRENFTLQSILILN